MIWIIIGIVAFIVIMSIGSAQEEKEMDENKQKTYFLELTNKITDLENKISGLEKNVSELSESLNNQQEAKRTKKYSKK